MIDKAALSQYRQPVQKTDKYEHIRLENSPYVCNSERHLTDVHYIYSHALKISLNSGHFYGSQAGLAEFFRCSKSTIYRGFQKLEASGFFEVQRKKTLYKPNDYRVLTHDDWASKHPNECVMKIEMPWTRENDHLGQWLFSASGGGVNWQVFQINNLRKLGLPEDEIKATFSVYWQRTGQYENSASVPRNFLVSLRKNLCEMDSQ